MGATFTHRESLRQPLTREVRDAGLKIARQEVVPSAIMNGLTEQFIVPYLLALGASTAQTGWLGAMRNGVLSLAQLRSADAVGWCRSRKTLVLWTAAVQAVLWVPLAFVGCLGTNWAVPTLIVLYTAGTTSAAFGSPAWGSILSEYLREKERGTFFGRLARTQGVAMLAAGLTAGLWLHMISTKPLLGFTVLCLGASACRAVSWSWLRRLPEGPWHEPPGSNFSFKQFISQARSSNFVRFTFAFAGYSLAANLASLYFAVYMLKELHYGYLTYAVVMVVGTLMGMLTVPRWGRIGDRFGNHVIMRWGLVGATVLPPLWLLSPSPAWLFGVSVLGGWLWGGINLAAVNFVYDTAIPAKRTRCLAYFNVVNGCAVSLGMLCGGWLLDWLPEIGGSRFAALFWCSGLLRAAAAAAFHGTVREVRIVQPAGLRQVMYDMAGERLIHALGFFSTRSGRPEDGRS